MMFYFAPLEGITGFIYRNAFHQFFGKEIDRYFTPFIATAREGHVKNRSLRDVLPENNEGLPVIPQLLSNNAEDFIRLSGKLKELGYGEVNLNLGCPYKTVVSKGKGSGFLGRKKELSAFLDEIFEAGKTEISIKTRLGVQESEEFWELLALFNRYPLKELIIHPRVQADFYGNRPRLAVFEKALKESKNPVCYNGDLFLCRDYERIRNSFPGLDRVMTGRGLLANPALVRELQGGKPLEKEELRLFHNKLYEDYQKEMQSDTNTLFKMKELWNYMGCMFPDGEKALKKIRKAQRRAEYESAVNSLFRECEIGEGAGFYPAVSPSVSFLPEK